MFNKIIKYIKFLKLINENRNELPVNDQKDLYSQLDKNLAVLKSTIGKSNDVIFHEFVFGVKNDIKALICYIDGLEDKKLITEDVIKALMVNTHITDPSGKLLNKKNCYEVIKNYILNVSSAKEITNFDQAIDEILTGNTFLIIDSCNVGISVNSTGGVRRSISQPDTEVVIRGPKEAFVENLSVNTSLLRRIIKNRNLIFENIVVGKTTRTDVCIAYLDGIADEKVIQEVRDRIGSIDCDSILESGYIEQYIEDHPFSPFATIGNSERPDKVSGKLLEGRVAILCNGTPIVLTVPHLFVEAFQVPEDYYSRTILSNMLRILRYLAFFITLMLPSLFIAVETYHQEMIPTVLLISFAAAREGIPFPIFVETLINETIFQLIRESGVRMPRAVGSAVSIVGTLVIGQAAVNAGIIGAPMVIITSLSAITSFIIPSLFDAIAVFRLFLIILSGLFGLYGILVGMLIMLAHMCSIKSFGTPFMSPVAPIIWNDLKDSILRFPLFLMKLRPKAVTWKKQRRFGGKD